MIVFTQFRGTLKMLGLMLQTLKIGFVYYYGGLTESQKRKALEAFKTRENIKVMVSLIQCCRQLLTTILVSISLTIALFI